MRDFPLNSEKVMAVKFMLYSFPPKETLSFSKVANFYSRIIIIIENNVTAERHSSTRYALYYFLSVKAAFLGVHYPYPKIKIMTHLANLINYFDRHDPTKLSRITLAHRFQSIITNCPLSLLLEKIFSSC